jgi:hypothetical protein
MPIASARAKDRLRGIGALALCALLGACEQVDLVYSIDLCRGEGEGVISANCRQCLKPPFARQCPQCQEPEADPSCSVGLAVTQSDAGTAADGGSAGGKGGMGSAGSSGQPGQAVSGTGGSAAPVSAGAQAPDPCNGPCRSPDAVCWAKEGTCVECLVASDCANATCDSRHRCVECTSHADCGGRACDLDNQKCVDCVSDGECTQNPVLNVCNAAHKCVDCDATHGCSDPANPACVGQACVACDVDSHCSDPQNKKCLTMNHTCVECLARADCDAPKPACDTSAHACVECLADTDCATQHCLEPMTKCVECEADGDCKTAASGHCGSNNSCVRCTSQDQCNHLVDTLACDTASGTCVECVDDSTCGDSSCIRAQHVCSTVKRGSLGVCAECQADTQCGTNLKCVALTFASLPWTKTYCLYSRAAAGGCGAIPAATIRPYTRTVQGVASVDGSQGPYCAPQTTCEALMAASNPVGGQYCDPAETCGIIGADDGVCNGANRCTYVCTTDADCPVEGLRICSGTGAQKFCSQAAM